MTKDELRDVAEDWLAPIDRELAELIDASNRMTIGAFNQRVQELIDRIPTIYWELNKQALVESLEDEIGMTMVKQLEKIL